MFGKYVSVTETTLHIEKLCKNILHLILRDFSYLYAALFLSCKHLKLNYIIDK